MYLAMNVQLYVDDLFVIKRLQNVVFGSEK